MVSLDKKDLRQQGVDNLRQINLMVFSIDTYNHQDYNLADIRQSNIYLKYIFLKL